LRVEPPPDVFLHLHAEVKLKFFIGALDQLPPPE
jgi:hypothetical protein